MSSKVMAREVSITTLESALLFNLKAMYEVISESVVPLLHGEGPVVISIGPVPHSASPRLDAMSVVKEWVSPFVMPADPPRQWINYAEQRPESAGAYRWRLPSVAVPGMFVTFIAHMRTRGAGHQNVISPLFDYWDGYRLFLPIGTQWQALDEPIKLEWHKVTDVAVEGLEPSPCPYCEKVPVIKGIERHMGGGCNISDPHKFNSWNLSCCGWGDSPTYKDPRELVARRESVLSGLGRGGVQ